MGRVQCLSATKCDVCYVGPRPLAMLETVTLKLRGNTGRIALVAALICSGPAAAQQNSGQAERPPMPAGPLSGTPPPSASSQQAPRPVGAPSFKAPSPELRAAYEQAFQLTMQNPSDPPTLAKFAELAIEVGDIEGAISALERLLLIDGEQADVKLELGVLYYRLGSIDAARMYLEAARTSKQASAEVKERADTFLKAISKK